LPRAVFYTQLRAVGSGRLASILFRRKHPLRKLLTVAVAATATLALTTAGLAAVEPNDSEATLTATASPKDSGTAKKPKNVKLGFNLKVDKPGTTVEVIEVLLAKGTKISGKGFKRCNIDDLLMNGQTGCSSGSKAGPKGTANAKVGPDGAPLNLDVYPFVEDANTLLFYLSQVGGGVQTVVKGEITNKGRKMAITIPSELRKPGGLDATLVGINQVFSGKRNGKYIVSSTACPKGGWKFGGNLVFATDRIDGAPAPTDETRESVVKCTK
jgi:hypothetical protein